MKYIRLTKEQLEELHPEFINFLVTQSITGEEWKQIKEKQPEVAEQELDVFSDLIWEGVLSKANYLQNCSSRQLFLFNLAKNEMQLIVVKITDASIDLMTTYGFKWLQNNISSNSVELFTASKTYSVRVPPEASAEAQDRNRDIFELIRQGAEIVTGKLYNAFQKFI
jgi:cag pathogenicity island protein 24